MEHHTYHGKVSPSEQTQWHVREYSVINECVVLIENTLKGLTSHIHMPAHTHAKLDSPITDLPYTYVSDCTDSDFNKTITKESKIMRSSKIIP